MSSSHRGDVVGLRPVLQQQGHYVRVSLLGSLVERGVANLEAGDNHTQCYNGVTSRGARQNFTFNWKCPFETLFIYTHTQM